MKKRHEKTKSAYKQKPPRDNSEAVLRYSIFQRQFTPVDSAPPVLHSAPETAKSKFGSNIVFPTKYIYYPHHISILIFHVFYLKFYSQILF